MANDIIKGVTPHGELQVFDGSGDCMMLFNDLVHEKYS
jgi:hypothetical protein